MQSYDVRLYGCEICGNILSNFFAILACEQRGNLHAFSVGQKVERRKGDVWEPAVITLGPYFEKVTHNVSYAVVPGGMEKTYGTDAGQYAKEEDLRPLSG